MVTAVENALTQLKDSAREKKLVGVIGTGVSMALTNGKNPALSWRGLIESGFAYGLTKAKITPSQKAAWTTQLSSDDMDDLLGAAEFMSRKLDAPNGDLYARWLESVFKDSTPENAGMVNAIRALQSAEIPLCTLNYDSLLERVTGLGVINFGETPKVAAWMRRESQGILHLHGCWDAPSSCVLGIRDYETTVSNEVRDLIQRTLSSFGRLLFIGCGDTFADPNFSALIRWLREKLKTATPQHYALVSAAEEAKRHADPSWHGFVEPISYGAERKDLPAFLLAQFPTTAPKTKRIAASRTKAGAKAGSHSKVLEEYRKFLLKDCGQMTIEGLRADTDTAQRRFDLERLFVPLKVLPTPPEIPAADPEREQKLQRWNEANSKPLPFGQIFKKHRQIALLAIPGGGKTMLLKRLAVAYADPDRRSKSDDDLPDISLTPVLIRCREWKEHIQRPIPELLKNIAAITGQAPLAELSEALNPLFKKGRVLLLVDGLDEIHNDSDRSTFVEHLESFLAQHERIYLVVTSREAGFSLVAPSIARFCERWRVAPLHDDAIKALCSHWHRLMIGETPEALAEADDLAESLLHSDSLRRLAENPLLLTMLLVVKHGAGRLPPDRVSLYERAVEVLLNTWNIRGHDPLNPKEAVPQLACVAFELLRKGKQTATEKDLLLLLEGARGKVPQIRLYAKDTPDQFLKRVELRSSLLFEAGHQLDGARAIPFYQFRHLTFQEYLSAVAVVEGHYLEYQRTDSVLTPLEPFLTAEEWKEVIPMAAVLARKQGEPLMAALVNEGNLLRRNLEEGKDFPGRADWINHFKLPASVARLVQCLAEEAQASPEIMTAALQLIALFARGCQSPDNWQALSRGPYGEELLHQLWAVYAPMRWPWKTYLRSTYGRIASYRHPITYWEGQQGREHIQRLLRSENLEENALGLLTIPGALWGRASVPKDWKLFLIEIESHLFSDNPALWAAAAWAFGRIILATDEMVVPATAVLDRLLVLCARQQQSDTQAASFALSGFGGLSRDVWTPHLTEEQRLFFKETADAKSPELEYEVEASLIVAFHSKDFWTEEELAKRLVAIADSTYRSRPKIERMLEQMGEIGRKLLHPDKGQNQASE
jgi:SIR2-like protein/NACHT domain-containing protein